MGGQKVDKNQNVSKSPSLGKIKGFYKALFAYKKMKGRSIVRYLSKLIDKRCSI
jgi:hypothetical protein